MRARCPAFGCGVREAAGPTSVAGSGEGVVCCAGSGAPGCVVIGVVRPRVLGSGASAIAAHGVESSWGGGERCPPFVEPRHDEGRAASVLCGASVGGLEAGGVGDVGVARAFARVAQQNGESGEACRGRVWRRGWPSIRRSDWGETLAVSGVDVGASVEEEDGDVWVPRVGGEVEGRAALAVRVADTFGHQASRTARWRMPSRRVSGGEGSGDGDRGGAARGWRRARGPSRRRKPVRQGNGQ